MTKKLENLNCNNFLSETVRNESKEWLDILKDYALATDLDQKLLLGIFPDTDEDDQKVD